MSWIIAGSVGTLLAVAGLYRLLARLFDWGARDT
jgi:hypothetical protein